MISGSVYLPSIVNVVIPLFSSGRVAGDPNAERNSVPGFCHAAIDRLTHGCGIPSIAFADLKPVGSEQVSPPETEPISEGPAIAFPLPSTVLECHFGSAVYARKCHLDLGGLGRIEVAAPPYEHETLARLPHQDGADFRSLAAGKLLKYPSASCASFKSNGPWR